MTPADRQWTGQSMRHSCGSSNIRRMCCGAWLTHPHPRGWWHRRPIGALPSCSRSSSWMRVTWSWLLRQAALYSQFLCPFPATFTHTCTPLPHRPHLHTGGKACVGSSITSGYRFNSRFFFIVAVAALGVSTLQHQPETADYGSQFGLVTRAALSSHPVCPCSECLHLE